MADKQEDVEMADATAETQSNDTKKKVSCKTAPRFEIKKWNAGALVSSFAVKKWIC